MGVVTDVEQGSSPRDMKSADKSRTPAFALSPRRALSPTRAISPMRAFSPSRKDSEESQALSPARKDVAEQSEPSIASSASSVSEFEAPVPRQFNVPLVVRVAGVALGLCAGNVNCIAFQAVGSFVSHQTGSWARVGMGDMDALLLVSSFVFGALLCGFLVSQKVISVRVALYDVCLIIQALLLVAGTFLADHGVARYIVAMSCGLQNGFATHWGGAALRTTHVTGLFTDVGLLIGRLMTMLARFCRSCGKLSAADRATTADDLSKLSLLAKIALAFLLGIYLGTHTYNAMGPYAFLIPAVAVGFVGSVCFGKRFLEDCFSKAEETEIKETETDIKDVEAGKVGGADAVSAVPGSLEDQEAEKTVAV